ncbi:MAG TPA: POTRA domain-containing protein [Gemmataceae bacterium]|nr:POTRA domain-containing protein [Gemmataceae bacterium]
MNELTCIFLFIQSLSSVEEAKNPPVVAEVVVVGNRRIATADVMKFIKTKPGQPFLYGQAMDDVSSLAASRLFRSILPVRTTRLPGGRVRVHFEVREFPNNVREVAYHNVRHLSERELALITGLRAGMPLDRWANRRACFEIQQRLRDMGFFFANVALTEGYDQDHERVVFNISEGPKVCIRKVRFFNWIQLPFLLEVPGVVEDTKQDAIFNPAGVAEDVARLEFFYRSRGYLNAHVQRELHFSDDFAQVDVTFHIGAGKRFRIANCSIAGRMDKKMHAELERLIKVRKGEFHSTAAVEADERRLRDCGGRLGKRLQVGSEAFVDPNRPAAVNLVYTVNDAPVDRVGEVIIVGNTVTRHDVIRKQVTLFPGEILDYTQLPVIEKRLAALKIFRFDPWTGARPRVTVVGKGKFKDIVVEVEETATGSLLLMGYASTKNGFGIRVTIEERNFDPQRWPTSWAEVRDRRAFRGAGQKVRLDSGDISLSPLLSGMLILFNHARTQFEVTAGMPANRFLGD